MRYGFSVNDGRMLVGDREKIKAMMVGALLAAGFDKPHSVQEEAEKALRQTEAVRDQVHRVEMESVGSLDVWLERGARVKGRTYLVRVGKDAPFRTDGTTMLVTYIAGLMVADGVGLEKATALGEKVAFALSEGGGYPDRVVTELRDQREVRAWFEDGTEGVL